MNKIGIIKYIIITFVMILASCKTVKKTSITNAPPLLQKTINNVIEDVVSKDFEYRTIMAKTTLELLAEGSKTGMKTNCYIKLCYNKDIQLSVRMPFINSEIFRINLTPDSLIIVDRLKKKYIVEQIANLDKKKEFQFNFYNLQALLTDRLFVPGKNSIIKKEYQVFNLRRDSTTYLISTRDNNGTIYDFTVDSNNRIVQTKLQNELKRVEIKWKYQDFIKDESYVYPTSMQALIKVRDKSINFNISYSQLEFDNDVNIDKQTPSKYNRVTIAEILKPYFN